MQKHWSKVEYLHESVTNPNIHIKGASSYYSAAWTGSFEESVVRYLYGDAFSLNSWEPAWPIDQLFIGSHVCIAAEVVILMGGNNTHRMDWISLYPFVDRITEAYQGKGDTVIEDGAWIGMRAMLMPGITIGEGAIVASGAIVTKDVEPYTVVAGNPAKPIKKRFSPEAIESLQQLRIYDWDAQKFTALGDYICSGDVAELVVQSQRYDESQSNV
ncbi:chloramphenicol O-acetyltransferase type B [Sphingobacterium nematocida]|uniref:Chloramphenicol acetyltransferase n=1 Tax=Sphingobacterium nematocida TaxID=1513896 RepID=A0A1T5AYA8_9SPHI|nr:CatB-related O-acetyltransferase [Sphingobacterium nematocida]SKB39767.1 chloramphenicol O-acetyltransferase type B [Sphingobacterium nematocida]